MRFMYVLPFSATRALVEFTLFSARLLDDDEYTRNIERYIARHLGIADFRVVEKERGVIPMSDRPFPRRGGRRVINIGTRAGRVKASTGYAFKRVQDDTAAIVMSMEVSGRPDTFPPDRTGFRTLDTLLLQIMYRRGDLSEQVFTALFKRNSAERLLRFLDEETTVWETIKVMATVPWVPFIGAWFRTKVLKRI
jgi:lycopene beta-cyclase